MHCIVNVIVAVIILRRRLCIVSDFTDDSRLLCLDQTRAERDFQGNNSARRGSDPSVPATILRVSHS